MTHTKANKSKILTLILGLATCFVLMLGIVLANPANTARGRDRPAHPDQYDYRDFKH